MAAERPTVGAWDAELFSSFTGDFFPQVGDGDDLGAGADVDSSLTFPPSWRPPVRMPKPMSLPCCEMKRA